MEVIYFLLLCIVATLLIRPTEANNETLMEDSKRDQRGNRVT